LTTPAPFGNFKLRLDCLLFIINHLLMNSNESVNELMRSILPLGYLDIQAAAELLEEANVSFSDF